MTNNSIQSFDFEGQAVRTVETPDGFGFVAKDVLEYFKVSNRNRTMQQLDDDEKGGTRIDTPGGPQNLVYLTESGFYHLLFILKPTEARGLSDEELNAKIEKVEKFKRWVTHEVLPSIRRHGGYMAGQESMTPEQMALASMRWLHSKVEEQQAQLEAQKPKVLFADAVSASQTSILVGQLAKIIQQNGVDIGQKRLFAWLRDHHYLSSRYGEDYNMPLQRYVEQGLFQIKESTHTNPDGVTFTTRTVKVTGKGQQYFVTKFITKTLEATA
jgi:anti-repressor protein